MKSRIQRWLAVLIPVGIIVFTLFTSLMTISYPSQAYPGGGESGDIPTAYPPPQITLTASPTPRPAKGDVTPTWVAPTPIPTTILSTAAAPRKGVAASMGDGFLTPWPNNMRPTVASWAYYWLGMAPLAQQYGVQYVPLAAGNLNPPNPAILLDYFNNSGGHHYWLVFNECENNWQCNDTPERAVEFFMNQLLPIILAIDPSPHFILGGVNAHPCGIRWLQEFVLEYRTLNGNENPPVAGWHFHLYPNVYPMDWEPEDVNCLYSPTEFPDGGNYRGWKWWGADSNDALHNWRLPEWEQDMNNIFNFVHHYGEAGDEVWITEMGCVGAPLWNPPLPTPGPIYCGANAFMNSYVAGITNWLNTEGRWVTRYAWYGDYDGSQIDSSMLRSDDPPPNWTSLGLYYAQVTPQSVQPFPQLVPQRFLPIVAQP